MRNEWVLYRSGWKFAAARTDLRKALNVFRLMGDELWSMKNGPGILGRSEWKRNIAWTGQRWGFESLCMLTAGAEFELCL